MPKQIAALAGHRVVEIAACCQFSLMATGSGEVYSCGGNDNGQLGHDDRDSRSLPTLVAALASERVVSVVAGGGLFGGAFSLAITAAGRIVSWGCGGDGRLGHGDESDLLQPTLLPLGV